MSNYLFGMCCLALHHGIEKGSDVTLPSLTVVTHRTPPYADGWRMFEDLMSRQTLDPLGTHWSRNEGEPCWHSLGDILAAQPGDQTKKNS